MAISRSIVRGHGGDITLENRPAERGIAGLRVVIRLPQGEGAS
jgi:signal transduction histidine kinase